MYVDIARLTQLMPYSSNQSPRSISKVIKHHYRCRGVGFDEGCIIVDHYYWHIVYQALNKFKVNEICVLQKGQRFASTLIFATHAAHIM